MHRLPALRVGVPVRRARDQRRARHDAEVHALRRSHLQRDARSGRPPARLRRRVPDARAAFRRSRRCGFADLEARRRARRLRADAGVRLQAGQQVFAAAAAARRMRCDAFAGARRAKKRWIATSCPACCAGSIARCRADSRTMRPTFSIILFTVLSGAGYGVWFLLGLRPCAGLADLRRMHPLGDGSGMAMRCAYPASSTICFVDGLRGSDRRALVLGRPSRQAASRMARAVAVAKLVAFARRRCCAADVCSGACTPGGSANASVAVAWPRTGDAYTPWVTDAALRPIGAVLALMCVVTVFCTAHIYSSLKPIRAWHNRFVAPAYLLLALYAGALVDVGALDVLARVCHARSRDRRDADRARADVVRRLRVLKFFYWRMLDDEPVGERGPCDRSRVARQRAHVRSSRTPKKIISRTKWASCSRASTRADLRAIAIVSAIRGAGTARRARARASVPVAYFAAWAALVGGMLGLFVERWLFFAEARHAVIAYYGR